MNEMMFNKAIHSLTYQKEDQNQYISYLILL
jgi:hypothetical protein